MPSGTIGDLKIKYQSNADTSKRMDLLYSIYRCTESAGEALMYIPILDGKILDIVDLFYLVLEKGGYSAGNAQRGTLANIYFSRAKLISLQHLIPSRVQWMKVNPRYGARYAYLLVCTRRMALPSSKSTRGISGTTKPCGNRDVFSSRFLRVRRTFIYPRKY
jgi:hypothetical protein